MNGPIIFDNSNGQQLRINTIGSWLKKEFGHKMVKLSVDGGFTCPNRDGSKGYGGCLFCSDSGSGDNASSHGSNVTDALNDQIEILSDKWPRARYIAYLQSHTNTYAPLSRLRDIYERVLDHPLVSGLAIATRVDCLDDDVLDLLEEINKRTFLWVELGLQTVHEKTMKDMNLCYSTDDYDRAVSRLYERDLRTVTHLILGLPGESREMILGSVDHVSRELSAEGDHLFGIKLHMLNVVKNSSFPNAYPGYIPFDTIEEYTDLLIDCLERIPPDITIHRIYGDVKRKNLIAPEWSWKKRTVLNNIHREMAERDTWQGRTWIGSNR